MTEIFHRRSLPHWYVPRASHFVTFRVAGSLPSSALDDLEQWKTQMLARPTPAGSSVLQFRYQLHKQFFARYDRHLDNDQTIAWLFDPRIAAMIRSSLYHFHEKKYHLLAYCIMPNHVHLLIHPLDGLPQSKEQQRMETGESEDVSSPLSGIMHSLKSYTAHKGNELLGREGAFWQHESYDHWVRDEDELERIVGYINLNPVKARLVSHGYDWFWSSAHDRYLMDGDTSGWLGCP